MNKSIPFTLDELKLLRDNYNTPYYIYDGDAIEKHAKKYLSTFKKYFPNFKQFFAVKATPNPSILNILAKCGLNFDCSSPEEIKLVKMVSYYNSIKSEIFYTSNYTSVEDIEFALNNNCLINLDDIDGLYNLEITKNIPQIISLRYNPSLITQTPIREQEQTPHREQEQEQTPIREREQEQTPHREQEQEQIPIREREEEQTPIREQEQEQTQLREKEQTYINNDIKSNIFTGIDTKFGMGKNKIIEAYTFAKKLGITKFGLHTMCASNQLNIHFWSDIINSSFDLINDLHKTLNIKILFINIGGGLGIPYRPTDKEIDLEDFVKLIRNLFDINIAKYKLDWEPILLTESGRYITGPYGYLVSTCKSIKIDSDNIFYGLDANMAHLMRPGMYDAYHHISIPRLSYLDQKSIPKSLVVANVVGTLCENNDWFAKNRELPIVEIGDIFIIHDTGAHSHSMGFQYNGKLRAPEILIKIDGSFQLIRRRETYEDYVSTIV